MVLKKNVADAIGDDTKLLYKNLFTLNVVAERYSIRKYNCTFILNMFLFFHI